MTRAIAGALPTAIPRRVSNSDRTAPALTSASSGAQLVVVGSHGRGPIRGALLGSTGLHLLRHAECPVLVARGHGGS